MKLLTIFFLFIYSSSFGQTDTYQKLLDTALRGHGSLFLLSRPLKITRLNPKEMRYYIENVRDYSSRKLDTVMFYQIIQNAKIADTTLWKEKELPNAILINERAEKVSTEYVIQKFKLTNKKQIRHFTKYVNKFNSTDISDRVIGYYSKPVFDSSKTFAIVQWDNGHGYLGGGGGIILYQLQNDNTWKDFGIILNWKY